MTDVDDVGVGTALLERFRKQRLPRALDMKKRVDEGGLLAEEDMVFLQGVYEDFKAIEPLLERHPEWKPLAAQIIDLWHQITSKALENEKAAGGSQT